MVGSCFDNVRQSLKCAVKCSQMLSGSSGYRSPDPQSPVSLVKVNKQTALDIWFFSKSNFISLIRCVATFSVCLVFGFVFHWGAGSIKHQWLAVSSRYNQEVKSFRIYTPPAMSVQSESHLYFCTTSKDLNAYMTLKIHMYCRHMCFFCKRKYRIGKRLQYQIW